MTSEFRAKDLANKSLKSTIRNVRKMNITAMPKHLLPNIHNKTHFKAATSVYLRTELEGSLYNKSDFGPNSSKINSHKSPQSLAENPSILKSEQHSDRKNMSVTFLSKANSKREKTNNTVNNNSSLTKTILEQCHIIRLKHPNSKKLNIKHKLCGGYEKTIDKIKNLQNKKRRNFDNMRDKLNNTHATVDSEML